MIIRIDDYPHGDLVLYNRLLAEPAYDHRVHLFHFLKPFEERGVPYVLGVSPALIDPEIDLPFLRSLRCCEVALHGYSHGWQEFAERWHRIRDTWPLGGEFAFASREMVREKIARGLDILSDFRIKKFIAPFNVYTQTLLDVLNEFGFAMIMGGRQTLEFGMDGLDHGDLRLDVCLPPFCNDSERILPHLDRAVRQRRTILLHWIFELPDRLPNWERIAEAVSEARKMETARESGDQNRSASTRGPSRVRTSRKRRLPAREIAMVTETMNYVSGGVRCIAEVLNRLSLRGFDTACYVTHPDLRCEWLPVRFPILPASRLDAFRGILISPYSPTAELVARSGASGRFYWVHSYEPKFPEITGRPDGWRIMSENSYRLDGLQYFATSTYVKMILELIYGRRVLSTLVPGGVDTELFRPGQKQENPLRVMFLSRENPFRGSRDIVEALRMVFKDGIDLDVCVMGQPLDMGGLPHRLVPPLPQPEFARLLGSAAVFIHASHFEGLPLPPLEGMACGCAVISTYVGASDYLLDGYNALVVPPKRPDKIAEALRRLIDDPDLRHRLGTGGHRTVAEGYTWEHTVDRLVEALEEGLERMRSHLPLGMAVDASSAKKLKGLAERERVSPAGGDASHREPIEVHESKDKAGGRCMGAEGNWLGKPLYVRPAGSGGLQDVNGVKGFLRVEDIHLLFRKAKQLPQGAVVVEIGSFMGLSAIVIAHGLMEAGNSRGRIFCVDTWEGSREHQEMEEVRRGDLFEEFNRNVRRTGVSEHIIPVRKTSVGAAEDFEDNSLDMVFIDGDHSYEGCLQDLRAWFPKVRPGGTLLGHDCTPQGTVRKAVEAFCDEFQLRFTVHEPPSAHFILEIRKPGTAESPLVSAIVSTYNAERFIRGCLEDLEAQTIADRLEIIVVDSGSTQNERSVVEEFQRQYENIVYIRTEQRETLYAAWNRGIRASRGRYLASANTDDRHRSDALEVLARALDEHPDASLAYADFLITDRENETFDTVEGARLVRLPEYDRELLFQVCYVGPQPMWRRTVHEEHGFFDESFVSAGDYEFWLRISRTCRFLHVPQTLGLYLESAASVEHANLALADRESMRARTRHLDAFRPPSRGGSPQMGPEALRVRDGGK